MKEKLHNIPLWLINIITIVSGIITIITPIITITLSISKKSLPGVWTISTFVVLSLFIIILFLRMRKYRGIAGNRMKETSHNYHKLLHETRDLFFDTMHSHKLGGLTINELSTSYKVKLSAILDNLCNVINAYTEREVCACIKLISYPADEEVIDKDNATLVTFYRSNNSSTERDNYEKSSTKEIYLKDYKCVDSIEQRTAVYQRHAWVDFDSDGKSELVVYVMYTGTQIGEYLVFHVENNKVYCFEFAERGMMSLKENGTYYGSEGAAIQGYYSLSFKNSTYEEMEVAYIDRLKEEFRIDGKNVTQKDAETFYAGFGIKKPASWETNKKTVEFRVNDSLPEYKATITYNLENPRLAETLVISVRGAGEQIQKIDLPENDCFTKAPVYALDVTFDGNLDLLVPSQSAASAVYFQAYVWNEKESQFIYAPTFENLANIALDTENKLILSYRSGNMMTSYGMSYYDTTKKDFIFKNSVYMELAENDQEIHFVEEEFKNGEWKIIKEHFIAGDDPYGPDKTNLDISHYYEKGSFWDLDSDKWNSYFLVDSNTYDVITPNQLYEQFLNGEIAANDNGQEKFLKDYFTGLYSNDDGYYKYTFIDMTGDGIDELCIKNIQLFFFTIENGKLNHWCTEGWTYVDLLSNGAIFYERDGAAPEHIDYQYYELDENGSVAFETTFSWYTATEWPEGPNKELIAYPDRYWVDNVEVTKEEYEEKTKEYMTLAEDRVTWYYGTVN